MERGNIQSFVASLEAERLAFQEFVELLKSEQETLFQGDIDRLAALAQLKSDRLVQLSQLAEKRNSHLVANSLPADTRGMEQWLQANATATPSARSEWNRLLDLAKTAQQLNQSNGTMIQMRLGNNQQALAVLQATANHASLYGPDGQTRTTGTGRPLGKV
jgi:flagella synthesis protein FlgN